jgi:hypothetical protein
MQIRRRRRAARARTAARLGGAGARARGPGRRRRCRRRGRPRRSRRGDLEASSRQRQAAPAISVIIEGPHVPARPSSRGVSGPGQYPRRPSCRNRRRGPRRTRSAGASAGRGRRASRTRCRRCPACASKWIIDTRPEPVVAGATALRVGRSDRVVAAEAPGGTAPAEPGVHRLLEVCEGPLIFAAAASPRRRSSRTVRSWSRRRAARGAGREAVVRPGSRSAWIAIGPKRVPGGASAPVAGAPTTTNVGRGQRGRCLQVHRIAPRKVDLGVRTARRSGSWG